MNGYSWNLNTPEQLLSLIGSVLLLSAYFLMVARPLLRVWYFSISMLGSALLLVVALIYHNLGFLLLESTWMSINAWGLWKVYHGHP
jgi:hypothetical protein